jgi:hypothetical protein
MIILKLFTCPEGLANWVSLCLLYKIAKKRKERLIFKDSGGVASAKKELFIGRRIIMQVLCT